MEDSVQDPEQRATRLEILDYYEKVMATLSSRPRFRYLPGTTFDFESATCVNAETKVVTKVAAGGSASS